MQATNDERNPVLNNPYEEPKYYYETDMGGNINYESVLPGRRPYGYDVRIVPGSTQRSMFSQGDFISKDPNAAFVNTIREQVKNWRQAGYPKASRITTELLNYWFNPQRQPNLRLFFCQREAVETAIWFNEIASKDPNMGNYLLNQLTAKQHEVSTDNDFVLPRTAMKMATGTGKTVVMAMLILYNFLNKRANPMDTRYADHFLIVAPSIAIRDRLSVLKIDFTHHNPYHRTDYYHQRGLIPYQFEEVLGGLNASIVITNYQQLQPRKNPDNNASPFDGKNHWENGEKKPRNDVESYSHLFGRILDKSMKGKRIVVFNDEGHHCYLPKTDSEQNNGDDDESKENNENAMVWYTGLRQMKLLGYKLQHVYDLSATPFYLKGSGYVEGTLFPWVVSDFGLVEAIESGLVKIPFLPVYDDAKDGDIPKLSKLYENIKDDLPKMGVRAQRKKDKEDNKDKSKATIPTPSLPPLLNTALEQFVKDYMEYDRGLREQHEEQRTAYTAPPVMIIVCNNTRVSQEVFRHLAGYQDGKYKNGEPRYKGGRYDVFSNYDSMMQPKRKQPTFLIDTTALDEASLTIDNTFKKVYAKEIAQFKEDFVKSGRGNLESIKDCDILREVINTVGKPEKLGGDIRCVVSVSMLTEGWDANTVTHVCGIRAFGSPLLCEQVIGRALRRQSYDLVAYDVRTGKEIDPKDRYRYKEENIIEKFPPEYARIIGVPFITFKGGKSTVNKPRKLKYLICADDKRQALEIRFPVINGYRSDNIDGSLTADYSGRPKFRLDPNQNPQTTLQTVVDDQKIKFDVDYEEIRDAEVIYRLAGSMLRQYYNSSEHGQMFYRFGDMIKIVEKWYNEQLEVAGGNGDPHQKRLVKYWSNKAVLDDINAGIHQANAKHQLIKAVMNYYNPEGSTIRVHQPTNHEVWPIVKSHVNLIVADKDSWEQKAAQMLDNLDCVDTWVRNMYLGFCIPYTLGGQSYEYEPTFIVRVKTADNRKVNIVVECQDFNGDGKGNKEIKRQTLKDYWIPAANNLQTYGQWDMLVVNDIEQLDRMINEKTEEL